MAKRSSITSKTFPARTSTVNDREWSSVLKQGLGDLYLEQSLVDVKLVVGDREFPCHRLILAAASPVFKAMFTCDMAEKKQERIVLTEFSDAAVMNEVLNYLYKGEITLTNDTAEHILSIAHYFQLNELQNMCERFMVEFVVTDNCIEMYFFGCSHECFNLKYKAMDVICRNFQELNRCGDFMALSKDQLITVLQFDDIVVSSEQVIFDLCLDWLKLNLSQHKDNKWQTVSQILRCVRFSRIDASYFYDTSSRNALLQRCENIKELKGLFSIVKYYYSLPLRRAEIDLNYVSRKYNSRQSNSASISRNCGIVFLCDPCKPREDPCLMVVKASGGRPWHLNHLPEKYSSKCKPCIVVTGDNVVFVCGLKAKTNSTERNLYFYMFEAHEASEYKYINLNRNASLECRRKFSLVCIDRHVFLLGGVWLHRFSTTVEEFDTQTESWTKVASRAMPVALASMATTSYRGLVYVFGGEGASGPVQSVYSFDPNRGVWKTLAPMEVARFGAGCVVFHDMIYVIGGRGINGVLTSVEVYNPVSNVWIAGPPLPTPIDNAGVCKYGDMVVVVGQNKQADVLLKLQDNGVVDAWRTSVPLLTRGVLAVGQQMLVLPSSYYSRDSPVSSSSYSSPTRDDHRRNYNSEDVDVDSLDLTPTRHNSGSDSPSDSPHHHPSHYYDQSPHHHHSPYHYDGSPHHHHNDSPYHYADSHDDSHSPHHFDHSPDDYLPYPYGNSLFLSDSPSDSPSSQQSDSHSLSEHALSSGSNSP